MRLTVLGSSASYAGAGQACSGYLVESGNVRILLDCGNGVISNLSRKIDPATLDAVFLTHAHVDHFADIYPLFALLRYAPDGPSAPLSVFAAAGVWDLVQGALSQSARTQIAKAFILHELESDSVIARGPLTIRPMPVDHIEPTFALRIDDGEGSLCYTSDTAEGERVVSAALGVDLLLAEATLSQEYAGRAPHMTATQAAKVALDAGVHELVLSHIWPTSDRGTALAQAQTVFGDRVHIASEMDTYDIRS